MQRLQNEMLPLLHGEAREWNKTRKRERKRGQSLTWGEIFSVATGVDQDVGLKGGVKVIICTGEGQKRE